MLHDQWNTHYVNEILTIASLIVIWKCHLAGLDVDTFKNLAGVTPGDTNFTSSECYMVKFPFPGAVSKSIMRVCCGENKRKPKVDTWTQFSL